MIWELDINWLYLFLIWPIIGILNVFIYIIDDFFGKNYSTKEVLINLWWIPLIVCILGGFFGFLSFITVTSEGKDWNIYKRTILNKKFINYCIYPLPVISLGLLWLI